MAKFKVKHLVVMIFMVVLFWIFLNSVALSISSYSNLPPDIDLFGSIPIWATLWNILILISAGGIIGLYFAFIYKKAF